MGFWQDAIAEYKDRQRLLVNAHIPPTDDVIVAAYQRGMSLQEIARHYHTSNKRASDVVKEAGIPLRRGGGKNSIDKMLMNSPDPCPELVRVMTQCCQRKDCPIENKCRAWYDSRMDSWIPTTCEELIKGFKEMRDES